MKKLLLCLFFSLGLLPQLLAQNFPFRVTVALKQPLVADWTYFVDDFRQPLTVNILFNDINEPTLDYRLRLTVSNLNTGETAKAYLTSPQFTQTATSGVLQSFSGSDLLPYFENLQGSLKGKPSDGNYQFCFEVVDIRTERILSNQGCAIGFIQTIRNPVIISPTQNSDIEDKEFLSIPLQWQLMNGVNPIIAQNIEFIVKLYEINDTYKGNLLLAERNGQAQLIFTSDPLKNTNYNYGTPNADPPLRKGARYLWKVQAQHTEELPIFEGKGIDQGVSTPSIFTLQKPKPQNEDERNALEPDDEDHIVIALTVKDKITGKKLQNVTVSFSADDQPLIQEKTNAEGEILRSDFVPTTYQVKIRANGYEDYENELIAERSLKNVKINLVPLPSLIKGQILDNSNEKPIEEAHVELRRLKEDGTDEAVGSIATDSEGNFEIKDILGAGEYFLNIEKPLYELFRSPVFDLKSDQEKTLKPYKIGNKIMGVMYGSIKGKVISKEKAVPNHEIYVLTPEQYQTYNSEKTLPTEKVLKAKTSLSGTYEIKLVPAHLKGEKGYIVLAVEGETVKEAHKKAQIFEQNQSPTVDFDLEPQPFRLFGEVNNEDKELVSGAVIELYEQDNKKIHKTTRSNGEGKFFMDGLERKKGGYGKLVVNGGNYKPLTINDIFKDDSKRQYEVKPIITFNNSVEGTAQDQFGKKISGVKVEIEGKTAVTDAKGNFKIENLAKTRTKNATYEYKGAKYTQNFNLPASANFNLKIGVISFIKPILLNVPDREGNFDYPEEVTVQMAFEEGNAERLGKIIQEWKLPKGQRERKSLMVNLPEGFAGKKLQFFAKTDQGLSRIVTVSLPKSIASLSPNDEFFNVSEEVTLTLRKTSARIAAQIKKENGENLPNAKLSIKGTNRIGRTDQEGKFVFEGLEVRDNYEVIVTLAPDFDRKVVKIENKQDRMQTRFEFAFEAKLKENPLQKNIKDLYGFAVQIENIKVDESGTRALLDGNLLIPEQLITPADAEKKDGKFLFPFKRVEFDIEKMQALKPQGRLAETFEITLDQTIPMIMVKPTMAEGKILARKVYIESIESSGEVALEEIAFDPESMTINAEVSKSKGGYKLSGKAESKAQTSGSGSYISRKREEEGDPPLISLSIVSINGDQMGNAQADLGDYKFKIEEAVFDKKKGESGTGDAWEVALAGDFDFAGSELYQGTEVGVSITGFTGEDSEELETAVSGIVTYQRNPIFVGGVMEFDPDEGVLKASEVEGFINTGLGFEMALFTDEIVIDGDGYLEDCFFALQSEEDEKSKVQEGMDERKQEAKDKQEKINDFKTKVAKFEGRIKKLNSKRLSDKQIHKEAVKRSQDERRAENKAEAVRKQNAWGQFEIEGIRVTTNGGNIRMVAEGKVGFRILKAPIRITKLGYSTSGTVIFEVEKGESIAERENSEKEGETYGNTATGEKRPEKSKNKVDFELERVSAEININDWNETVFSIYGKLAIGVPLLKVRAGRITMGGRKWGGEFGVSVAASSWTAEGNVDLSFESDPQTNKVSLTEYAVEGKVWIGRGEGKPATDDQIQGMFRFEDSEEKWALALSYSKDQPKMKGFRITRLGGSVTRYKKKDVWEFGIMLGLAKGEGETLLAVDIEELVLTVEEGTITTLDLKKARVTYGTRVDGWGTFLMDFKNQRFDGALRVEVEVQKGMDKFRGRAAWAMDFKYDKYGFILDIAYPLYPQVLDLRGRLMAGNELQRVQKVEQKILTDQDPDLMKCTLESTTIVSGFYLMLGVEKEFRFEEEYGPFEVSAKLGYKVQMALGVEIATSNSGRVHTGFSIQGYVKASLALFGVDLASISAEVCAKFTARMSFSPVYCEGEGTAYVKLKGCVVLLGCAEAQAKVDFKLERSGFSIDY